MSDTYRDKFIESTKPKKYERQYARRSYGEIIWTIEQGQLLDFLKEFRLNHPRIYYLDFAAGTGRVISFLEQYVYSAVGVEISPAMVEIARPKLRCGQVLCTDITAPGTSLEGQYDLITAFRFFLNAETDLKRTAMKGLAARLKDESSRLIFTNHGNPWSHKLAMRSFPALRRAGRGYISEGNYMTLAQAQRLVEEAGLVIEKVMGCGVLGPTAQWIIPFERLLAIESSLGTSSLARHFGVNQMYVARLQARSAHSFRSKHV